MCVTLTILFLILYGYLGFIILTDLSYINHSLIWISTVSNFFWVVIYLLVLVKKIKKTWRDFNLHISWEESQNLQVGRISAQVLRELKHTLNLEGSQFLFFYFYFFYLFFLWATWRDMTWVRSQHLRNGKMPIQAWREFKLKASSRGRNQYWKGVLIVCIYSYCFCYE